MRHHLLTRRENWLVPLLTRSIIRRNLIELMKTPGRNRGPETAKKMLPAGLAAAETTLQPVSELHFGTDLVSNLGIGLEEYSRYISDVRKRKTLGQPRRSNLNMTAPLAVPPFWEQEMRLKHHLRILYPPSMFSRSLKVLEKTQSGRYRLYRSPHWSYLPSVWQWKTTPFLNHNRRLYQYPYLRLYESPRQLPHQQLRLQCPSKKSQYLSTILNRRPHCHRQELARRRAFFLLLFANSRMRLSPNHLHSHCARALAMVPALPVLNLRLLPLSQVVLGPAELGAVGSGAIRICLTKALQGSQPKIQWLTLVL